MADKTVRECLGHRVATGSELLLETPLHLLAAVGSQRFGANVALHASRVEHLSRG